MRTSIQVKIVMIYLCVIIIVMMVIGTFIVYNIEERDYKNIQANLEKIAANMEVTLNWQSGDNLALDIKSKMNILNENHIYILDAQGKVDIGTSSQLLVGDTVTSEVVIRAISTKSPATAKIIHFANTSTGPKYTDHARPIIDPVSGEITAIIYVSANIAQVYDNMLEVMKTIGVGALIAVVITGVFGFAFSKMITSPIKKLTNNAKRLATGDIIERIPIESNDEIGELTQSFNYMAIQLGITMDTIVSEKNKLEKIFEHMADGVMAFDREGVLIHTNSICYEMLGPLNMGHRFDSIFPKLGMNVSFQNVLKSNKAMDEQMLSIQDKYLRIHFAPYVSVKQEPDGLVVVMQDVTKQQKLDEMRKEFVANVSHELRTPLTTVKSYTETLMEGAIDDREVAMHFLSVMDKEADRMTTLVKDLLELSRIDNHQIQLYLKELDIKYLIEEALCAHKIHISKKGHQLVYQVDEEATYKIYADETRIKQVIHNILSNAIKYSIDPGFIRVMLSKQDEDIIVCIEDTGIGIPAEDIDRIFERFYRVDKARSRKMGGTGLGLSIAKELVELHGGTIAISSTVGQGTQVKLQFKPYCKTKVTTV